ncbi:MAG TPA: AAA family ATPase [Firmicutes bacterium]|nr:AAA family ATPase [Bacillota bacterium]
MRRFGRELAIGFGAAFLSFLGWRGFNVVPVVLLIGVLALLFHLQLGGAIGKRFRVVNAGGDGLAATSITFDDVGGQEVAKRELLEALEFVKDIDRVKHLGIRPLKGILLTGPPGTGKTLLAKAAASYIDSVFISASGSEFIEMYAGVGAQRVRQLFSKARSMAAAHHKTNAVVFIDEIEVLGGKRGQHSSHLEYDQTLNQLLVEMDGLKIDDDVRVLVIGATNRVDLLDPALLRPGRFDRVVKVDLPDREGRLSILSIHTRGKPLASDVDLNEIARETFGFSGAHLESLANEAAILAMRQGKREIGHQEFKEALEKVMLGEKLDRRPGEAELKRIAYHEIGHAMASEITHPGSVKAVTITPRGNALGYMRQSPGDDKYIYTKGELEDQIMVALAGAVNEELAFGDRSTGARGDYDQAISIAREMVSAGMSSIGIVSPKDIPQKVFHEAIKEIISGQETRARQVLSCLCPVADRLSRMLLEQEKLSGDQLRAILAPALGSTLQKCVGE